MDKVKLEQMAALAFTNVKKAREEVFTAVENAIEARAQLDTDKSAAMLAGIFDGKNAEAREAQAQKHLEKQYTAVAKAERRERGAKFQFDQAALDLETVKVLLRIAEMPDPVTAQAADQPLP